MRATKAGSSGLGTLWVTWPTAIPEGRHPTATPLCATRSWGRRISVSRTSPAPGRTWWGGLAEAAAPFLVPEAGLAEEVGADVLEVAEAAETGIPRFIYRTGSQTENALTDAAGVSFRDSVSSAANGEQVFQ